MSAAVTTSCFSLPACSGKRSAFNYWLLRKRALSRFNVAQVAIAQRKSCNLSRVTERSFQLQENCQANQVVYVLLTSFANPFNIVSLLRSLSRSSTSCVHVRQLRR